MINKAYKVIWSRARGCYVVASELAKSYSGGAKRVRGKAARAAAACMALMLLPNAAWAATHTSQVTSGDTDSNVTVSVSDSNIGVYANNTTITLGNSADPGTVSVTAGTEASPLAGSNAYAISSQQSGTLTIYGDAVTLGAYTSYANAYGQFVSGSETIASITAGSLAITASTTATSGSAYAIYNSLGTNTVNVTDSVTLGASGTARGVGISNSGTNTITAGSLDINANATTYYAWGISNSGTNTITADTVNITASAPDQAQGISNTGTNTINAAGDVVITAESTSESASYSAWGISNSGTNTITGDTVAISAESASYSAWGISNSGTNTITGDTVAISAVSAGKNAYALTDYSSTTVDADTIEITAEAPGDAYGVTSESGGSVTLGNESSNITVTTTTKDSSAIGIMALASGSTVTVSGESLTINSTATGDGTAFGIHVQNGTQNEEAPDNAAHVIINAGTTTVVSDDLALSTFSNGQLDINGNLYATADHAIDMRGYSTMNINTSEENTVVLNGDIVFETPGASASSGTAIDAFLNLNLTNEDSSWTGNTYAASSSDGTFKTGGTFNLTLSNGATWNVTDVSDKFDDGTTSGETVTSLAVTNLTSDGGVISLTEGGTAVITDVELTGDGLTVNVSDDGGSLDYDTMTGDGGLTKTGDGTLTLATDTGYTGVTTVEEGTLDVGSIAMASEELTIYSGATFSTDTDRSFSTLKVNAAEGGTAIYDGNLDVSGGTMTFISSVSPDEALLTVTGDADVSNSTYVVGVSGGTSFAEGTTLTLITAEGTLTANGLTQGTSGGEIQIGSTVAQPIAVSLRKDGSSITAVAEEAKATNGSKALAESWLSGLNLTTQGADLIADKGIDAAVRAAAAGDKFGGFATVSGGSNRYESGSSIDMDNFNLLAGFAGIKETKKGRLAVGAFYEYGDGDYDTYNSFNGASLHGDGDTHYYGGGILARMDFTGTDKGHSYAEFSGRAGRLHNDYSNSGLRDFYGRIASFDSDTTYYGFHLGGGYVLEISDKTSLDVYGKYFWTRQQGDDVTLSTGEALDFDAATSSRLRIGARAKFAGSKQANSYVGLAWEHEFDGEANARTNGYRISSPSVKGHTGIAEAGITITPTADVPFDIDLNIQGYMGKREGFVGGVAFKWLF